MQFMSETPLPGWLERTAERTTRRQSLPEQIITEVTCSIEHQDGFAVKRCEQIRERFRLCADGQKEMVESSSSTFIEPVDGHTACSSSGRLASSDEFNTTVAPVLSATLGQMLDDFFQYATELQHSLEQQGVDMSAAAAAAQDSRHKYGAHKQQQQQSSQPHQQADNSSTLGLFGWWQRRKNSNPVMTGLDQQPSLQQLVRQSSSEVQEI